MTQDIDSRAKDQPFRTIDPGRLSKVSVTLRTAAGLLFYRNESISAYMHLLFLTLHVTLVK